MAKAFAPTDKEEIGPILSMTKKSRVITTSVRPENYTSLMDVAIRPTSCGEIRTPNTRAHCNAPQFGAQCQDPAEV